ncbi:hypothetical protein DT351_03290 [Latilactobacillus curvatus]|uniref:Uncharacterized protein n=1 Tax=Latilactobacillus curvatus TaxID=28038 RepID=A0A385ACQ3_LATCU|nr:hypothetical protein [Latilactobacillus curvatus]AXN35435.1 hypothetical protein DT351_03290 [Latilactobacillus curvatus]
MDNYEQLKADNKRLKKQVKQLATYNSDLKNELEFAQATIQGLKEVNRCADQHLNASKEF